MKTLGQRPLIAIVLVLLLTACGAAPASTSTNNPSASASAAAKPDYVIGAVLALTGAFATTDHDSNIGLQVVVDRINQSGGVNGHKLSLVTRDSQSDPGRGALAAQDLIANVHPDMLVSGFLTTIVLSILPATTSSKVITLGGCGTAACSDPAQYPYNFVSFPPAAVQSSALISAAKFLSGTTKVKLGVLNTNEASGMAAATAIQTQAAAAGVEFTGAQSYTTGTANLDVQMSRLRSAGANVVVLWGFVGDGGAAMKAVQDIGWNDVRVIGNTGTISTNISSEIPAGVASQFRALSVAISARATSGTLDPFVDALAKVGTISSLTTPVVGNDALMIWKWAVEKAGSTDADKVKAALETLSSLPAGEGPKGLLVTDNPGYSPTLHGEQNADLSRAWALIKATPAVNGTYEGEKFSAK